MDLKPHLEYVLARTELLENIDSIVENFWEETSLSQYSDECDALIRIGQARCKCPESWSPTDPDLRTSCKTLLGVADTTEEAVGEGEKVFATASIAAAFVQLAQHVTSDAGLARHSHQRPHNFFSSVLTFMTDS